ncbi:MAG: hypothetical protein AAF488_00175 [Planctomycetota bacterium]
MLNAARDQNAGSRRLAAGAGWIGAGWIGAILIATLGCAAPREAVETAPPSAPERSLETDPTRVTLEQRRAQPVRGFGGDVVLRIRDITGGQTILSVHGRDASRFVDPVSVELGDVVSFSLGSDRYYVQLVELKNFLFGGDFAVFTVGTHRPQPLPKEPVGESRSSRRSDGVAMEVGSSRSRLATPRL